jgi:hypothetical protein
MPLQSDAEVIRVSKATKKHIEMGYAIRDANAGWKFVEVIDYGDFGAGHCHIQNHAIRYGHIVQSPTNPDDYHVYGSDCICKFWICSMYKNIDPVKFEELYAKYRPMFLKFTKLVYQMRKHDLEIPPFPQTFPELEDNIKVMRDRLAKEIARKKALVNQAMQQIKTGSSLRRKKRAFCKTYPEVAEFISLRANVDLLNGSYHGDAARDFLARYDQNGEIHRTGITPKQLGLLKNINKKLKDISTNGNPTLARKILKLIPTVPNSNSWLRHDFLPSLVRQLTYKKDLSPKQWAVLERNKLKQKVV